MEIDYRQALIALAALAVAFLISFLATPLVKSFAQKVGAMDVPREARRVHDHPIPRMGGLAIFLGFLLSVVIFADISRQIRGVLLGAVIIVIVGVVDDIVSLPAMLKFVLQIFAALVAVAYGVEIHIFSNPLIFGQKEFWQLGVLSIPITVLWIVGVTNSVNLIDGLDGLAVGVSSIASVTMLVIAFVASDSNDAIVLAAITGACVGFMPYNFNPAKIFMGDTGALLLGYVLATMSIIGFFKFYAIITFVVPILALALPVFDTSFAIFRRLLKGQSPMTPDRGHFHHRLIDMGLNQKQAVAILYSISAVLGLAAVIIATSGEIRAVILVAAFAVSITIASTVKKGAHQAKKDQQGAQAAGGITPHDAAPRVRDDEETEDGSSGGPSER